MTPLDCTTAAVLFVLACGYLLKQFGLRGFAEALQMELKAHGIAVCVAFPPDTDTPG
jgi:short-subunit dehydrogenase